MAERGTGYRVDETGVVFSSVWIFLPDDGKVSYYSLDLTRGRGPGSSRGLNVSRYGTGLVPLRVNPFIGTHRIYFCSSDGL